MVWVVCSWARNSSFTFLCIILPSLCARELREKVRVLAVYILHEVQRNWQRRLVEVFREEWCKLEDFRISPEDLRRQPGSISVQSLSVLLSSSSRLEVWKHFLANPMSMRQMKTPLTNVIYVPLKSNKQQELWIHHKCEHGLTFLYEVFVLNWYTNGTKIFYVFDITQSMKEKPI